MSWYSCSKLVIPGRRYTQDVFLYDLHYGCFEVHVLLKDFDKLVCEVHVKVGRLVVDGSLQRVFGLFVFVMFGFW